MSVSIGTYDEDDNLGAVRRKTVKFPVRSPSKMTRPLTSPPKMPARSPPKMTRPPPQQIQPISVPVAPTGPTDAQIQTAAQARFAELVSKMPAKEQAEIALLFQQLGDAAKSNPRVRNIINTVRSQVASQFSIKTK